MSIRLKETMDLSKLEKGCKKTVQSEYPTSVLQQM